MTDQPRFTDVDVAMVSGVIQLHGDGDQLIALLPGEKAEILRDMLADLILTRDGLLSAEFADLSDVSAEIAEESFAAQCEAIAEPAVTP